MVADDRHQRHILPYTLSSPGKSFIAFDLFDDAVISLFGLLDSLLWELICWFRSCDFAFDVVLPATVLVVAETLFVCDGEIDLVLLIWKLSESASKFLWAILVLFVLGSFVVFMHGVSLSGREKRFLLVLELFKSLLEFCNVETLVSIKVADLEGFGNGLLLLEHFIHLSTVLLPPFLLFYHNKL